ncbi:peptide chain release factor N(5)-glutamine methyltransferase [Psychroserpens sp. S379A]|uniref:peptide chain release factor N(5)-glutamine methyltransferase n=1 Tax=Psychroserpens sp. S379A TaxID=3415137 RepID=UPI003C7A85E8
MRLKTVLNDFHSTLDEYYGKDEVNSFFDLLMEHYLKIKRIDLALNPKYEIDTEEHELFFKALQELKLYKPIQYIIGETEFYGLPFKVNEHTLIPRPETEELVDWIIKCHTERSDESPRILDIGTGTGCIPITLAEHMANAQVFSIDVSEEALQIAKQNAMLNDVDVKFIHDDILSPHHTELSEAYNYDVIVSNPPYVRDLEKAEIKSNVLDYEPHLALFVDNENPLQFYKAICEFAQKYLNEGGALYFEINEYLGQEMIQLLNDFGFNKIELKQDLFEKNRMIRGFK